MPRIRVHQLDGEDGDVGATPVVQPDHTVAWGPGSGGSGREVLMASGVSFPAEPLESSAGGDWLYGIPGG